MDLDFLDVLAKKSCMDLDFWDVLEEKKSLL